MSTKAQPTTLFSAILSVHAQLLMNNGYSEDQIDSTVPGDTCMKELASTFHRTVMENFWSHREADFQLTMTGRYQRPPDQLAIARTDTVRFQFYYRYDPALIKLHLVRLKATLNRDFQTEYLLHGPASRHLPKADDVYQDLLVGWKKNRIAAPAEDPEQHVVPRRSLRH